MKQEDVERVTAWVTKYALTTGIEKVDGEVNHRISSRMLCWGRGYGAQNAHGDDWHRTEQAAVDRANKMLRKKILSLKAQIERLEAASFKIGG